MLGLLLVICAFVWPTGAERDSNLCAQNTISGGTFLFRNYSLVSTTNLFKEPLIESSIDFK